MTPRDRLLRAAVTVAIALLAALAVSSALILAYGRSPAQVYAVLLSHTWGDVQGFGQVLFKATPLVFTGLAVAVAFHAGLLNIGAEGQLLAGSFVTALVGAALPSSTPWILAIPAALAAGATAGAAVATIPGVLKARVGAHEVITTIMLNFIVQSLVLWAGRRGAFVEQTVHTREVVPGARLPSLELARSASSTAVFVAILCAVAIGWFLYRTRRGFELRAVGKNPSAAEAGGVSLGRTIVGAMALSGALAGLVGSGTVLGYRGYFEEGMGAGAGFMGIAVALVGRNHPAGVIFAALLFGTLAQGGLAVNAIVPKEIVEVIQAVIILGVAMTSPALRRLEQGRVSWSA